MVMVLGNNSISGLTTFTSPATFAGATTFQSTLNVSGTVTTTKPVKSTSLNDITGTDLNSLFIGGSYMGYNLSNSPTGSGWKWVEVVTNGSDQVHQRCSEMLYDTGRIFERGSTDGGSSWSSWQQIATYGNTTESVFNSSTAKVIRHRGSFSSSDSSFTGGLDGIWGANGAYDGYWSVSRPGYSSFVIVITPLGSVGTIQFAGSYNDPMYRRTRVDNLNWTGWRTVD